MELWKDGSPVRLQPQPAQVLCFLVKRAGNLVTREEIKDLVWQGETFVDFDQGLNYCIRQIRIALADSADSPRFITTVPRRGYRFVADIEPVVESASIDEATVISPVVQQSISPSPPLAVEKIKASGRLPGKIVAGIAVTCGLLGVYLSLPAVSRLTNSLLRNKTSEERPTAVRASERTSIAVLRFENLGGSSNDAWLSMALTEMLSTELAEGERIRLVSGEEVFKAGPTVASAGSFSQETLSRLRRQLGADLIIRGAYTMLPNKNGRKMRMDVWLQDTRDGRVLASFAKNGYEAGIFNLVTSTGETLREKLGVDGLSVAQRNVVQHSFPSSAEARRLYADGLNELRRFRPLSAQGSLKQVVLMEPNFAPAHFALSQVWSALGYNAKATEEAKKAVDLSSNLSREEQLSTQAHFYELAENKQKSVETLRTLTSFFPDDLDYGIRLAAVLAKADSVKESLDELKLLRSLSSPTGDSPRLDLLEAQIRTDRGEFKQALPLAESALQKGNSIGARLLVCQALFQKAFILQRLGSPDASLQAAAEMKRIAIENDLPNEAARSLLVRGDVLYDQGQSDAAREEFETALAAFRETGDEMAQARAFQRIGNTYHDQGKLIQSRDAYKRALDFYRQVQSLAGVANLNSNLANTLDSMGDLNGALKAHQDSLSTFETIGRRFNQAIEWNNIAVVQLELGHLDRSDDAFKKALSIYIELANQRGVMYCQSGIGDLLFARGRVAEAQQQYEAAHRTGEQAQENGIVSRIEIQLVTTALIQGRLGEAESWSRRSVAGLLKGKDPEGSAIALAYLSRVLLAQGKKSEAQDAALKAQAYSSQISSLPPQFEVTLAVADLEAATGKKDAARARLLTLLNQTRRYGYAQYILEARRGIAGLETGETRERQLKTVSNDAVRSGFGGVAAEISQMQLTRLHQ